MIDILQFLLGLDQGLLMVVIVAVLTAEVFAFSFPKEVVLIFAGFIFGLWIGSILNLLGLMGAAWLGYEGGRLGKFGVERLRGTHLVNRYESFIERRGLIALMLARLFPFTPNDVLSITTGFVEMRRLPYLLITFVTAIPYAIFWAYLGTQGLETIGKFVPSVFDPITWVVSVILVLILLWWLSMRVFSPKNEQIVAPHPPL